MVPVLVFTLAMAAAPIRPMPAHVQDPPAQQATLTPQDRPMTDAESEALPKGDGRDAVAFMCVPCHGVLVAIAARKTPIAWDATVQDMRVKGAKGTDEQAEAAAKYLSKFFAAVDVNTATAAQLTEIAGFTADEAAAIVAWRDAGHTFKSFTDVRKVPGLDPKRLTAAKPRLAYAPK
jgi:DNA uptake protein ComE-like DNA-binding protein